MFATCVALAPIHQWQLIQSGQYTKEHSCQFKEDPPITTALKTSEQTMLTVTSKPIYTEEFIHTIQVSLNRLER